MKVGPIVSEGVLVGYGDYDANTGPIDIIAVSEEGVVTTLLAAFDTEQTASMRRLGEWVYIPAVDPKTNTSARLATNQGGMWHTIVAQPPDVGVAVHLFDVTLDPSSGDLLACGSRGPDVAFVWRSTDMGATWTEDLAHVADGGGFNRFYRFRESSGRPVVTTAHGSPGYYVLADGEWTPAATVAFDATPVAYNTSRLPIAPWTSSAAPDGSIWLCDGSVIYLIPPP